MCVCLLVVKKTDNYFHFTTKYKIAWPAAYSDVKMRNKKAFSMSKTLLQLVGWSLHYALFCLFPSLFLERHSFIFEEKKDRIQAFKVNNLQLH